jgi:hypothetical protein
MATQSLPSLYDRRGGVYSIATVVDDFIDRIMQQTLDKFAVPLAEQAEIKAIIASTRSDIVV